MKAEDMNLTPEMFRQQASDRVALGLILAELVRNEGLQAKPEQVKARVEEAAQTYEQPDAVVRWHYEKRERLADFEALAVEQQHRRLGACARQRDRRADDVRGADGRRPQAARDGRAGRVRLSGPGRFDSRPSDRRALILTSRCGGRHR